MNEVLSCDRPRMVSWWKGRECAAVRTERHSEHRCEIPDPQFRRECAFRKSVVGRQDPAALPSRPDSARADSRAAAATMKWDEFRQPRCKARVTLQCR